MTFDATRLFLDLLESNLILTWFLTCQQGCSDRIPIVTVSFDEKVEPNLHELEGRFILNSDNGQTLHPRAKIELPCVRRLSFVALHYG